MSNSNGIHHVIKSSNKNGSQNSFCGKILWRYDTPIELDHAKRCVEQGTYLQPCKRCMKSALKGI